MRRDAELVMQAIEEFGTALELWNDGAALRYGGGGSQVEENRRNARMVGSVAAAYFYLAEPSVEILLARAPVRFAGDSDRGSASGVEQLRAWVSAMATDLNEPARFYVRLGDALQVAVADPWVAASAARMALLHEHFADTLMRTPIPAGVAGLGNDHESYCGALAGMAAPLRKKTAALRKRCQTLAAGEWRGRCLALSAQLVSVPARR